MKRGWIAERARELGVTSQRVSQIMANTRGLCGRCYRPKAAAANTCASCRKKERVRQCAAYHARQAVAGRKSKRVRCGACLRVAGHNARTCPKRVAALIQRDRHRGR